MGSTTATAIREATNSSSASVQQSLLKQKNNKSKPGKGKMISVGSRLKLQFYAKIQTDRKNATIMIFALKEHLFIHFQSSVETNT